MVMKLKYSEKCGKSRKRINALFSRLEGKAIVVEGKKDARALARLGFSAYPAAGRRNLAARIGGEGAVVLTDLDSAGDELALIVKAELEPYMHCDTETRKQLGAILDLRNFEDIVSKLEKFNGEYPE